MLTRGVIVWQYVYMTNCTAPNTDKITAAELKPGHVLVTVKYTGFVTRRRVVEVTRTERNTYYKTDKDRNADPSWSGWVLPNEYGPLKVEVGS